MLPRQTEILRILDAEGPASIAALAERLAVSSETVRRDLRQLAEEGAVLRSHGAVALAGQTAEAPFRARMRDNAAAKQAIARAFAAEVRDGDSLMLDTGTTTSFLARALVGRRGLTVVTNSTDAARILGAAGARVFLAGGELRADSGAVLGSTATAFFAGFRARWGVVSAGAVDEGGVMDFDPAEADVARAILRQCARRVLVTDASKFGRRAPVAVAEPGLFDLLVTDAAPPAALAAAFAHARLIAAR